LRHGRSIKRYFHGILLGAVFFASILAPQKAGASSFGIDLTFHGATFSFLQLKTHTYFLLGPDAFAIGPAAFLDGLLTGDAEAIGGLGMRFGRSVFFEIDAGYNLKRATTKVGHGVAIALIAGAQITGRFRISVPVIFHYMMKGLPKRWTIDVLPYIGVDFKL